MAAMAVKWKTRSLLYGENKWSGKDGT